MKIIKTTDLGHEERSIVPIGEKLREMPKKVGKFFSANGKKTLIIFCSILLIGAAIYLNWMLFGSNGKDYTPPGNNTGNDNTGDNEEPLSYFALAMLDRQRARDEAIEVLQQVVDSSDADSEEKSNAIASIARIAADIEAEANIETLIKAKGFTQCIAVINNGNATVIVEADGLMPNQLVQIKEIVYEQAGISPMNIKIIEKKPDTPANQQDGE